MANRLSLLITGAIRPTSETELMDIEGLQADDSDLFACKQNSILGVNSVPITQSDFTESCDNVAVLAPSHTIFNAEQ